MRPPSRSSAVPLPDLPVNAGAYPAVAADPEPLRTSPATFASVEESRLEGTWVESLFRLLRVGDEELPADETDEGIETVPAETLLALTTPEGRSWQCFHADQSVGMAVEPRFPPPRVMLTEPVFPPSNQVPAPGAAIPMLRMASFRSALPGEPPMSPGHFSLVVPAARLRPLPWEPHQPELKRGKAQLRARAGSPAVLPPPPDAEPQHPPVTIDAPRPREAEPPVSSVPALPQAAHQSELKRGKAQLRARAGSPAVLPPPPDAEPQHPPVTIDAPRPREAEGLAPPVPFPLGPPRHTPPVGQAVPSAPAPFPPALVCAPAGALLWDGASLRREWHGYVARLEWQLLQLAEHTGQSGQTLDAERTSAIETLDLPAVGHIRPEGRPQGTPARERSSRPPKTLRPKETPAPPSDVRLITHEASSLALPLTRMAAALTGETDPGGSELVPCPEPSGGESGLTVPGQTALLPLAPPEPRAVLAPATHEFRTDPARHQTVSYPSVSPLVGGAFRLETSVQPLTSLCSSWMEQMSHPPPADPHAWRTPRAFPSLPQPRSRLAALRKAIAPQHAFEQVLQRQLTTWTGRLGPAEVTWIGLAIVSLLTVWFWNPRFSAWQRSPVADTERAEAEPAAPPTGFARAAHDQAAAPGFRERIANRSAIELREDFRSGLGLWTGSGNWAKSWRFDRDGVVRPGQMALYEPSVPMQDYELQLFAALEQRSLSWAVRASNLRNYIGMRIHGGGRGTGERSTLERWTVTEGRITRRQTVALDLPVVPAQSVRVRMEIRGNLFRTWVEGRVVDVFIEETHPAGGVGLFSSPNDRPRVYRLELTHQQDFFGKLCSFFATHPITKAGTRGS
ncbi:MAG: hypothetical protein ACK55F_11130 [Acidobacteriota bacterium]|jgi:hypothetical protein